MSAWDQFCTGAFKFSTDINVSDSVEQAVVATIVPVYMIVLVCVHVYSLDSTPDQSIKT